MTVNPKPVAVGIYARISEDSDDDRLGVERQIEDCKKRIERDPRFVLGGIYVDNDRGASELSTDPRPDYDRLVADVQSGRIDWPLSYSRSRLTRRTEDNNVWVRVSQTREKNGISPVTVLSVVSGDFDLSTADGVMMFRLLGTVDAAEVMRMAERLKRRQRQNRDSGHAPTKRAFGWGRHVEHPTKPNRHVVADRDKLNDLEGDALKDALREIREGVGLRYICRDWNFRGLTTVSGRAWTPQRLREVLIRWRNAGVLQHLGEPETGATGSWEKACERDELEEVRALLLDPQRRTSLGTAPSSLLSGIATCSVCGRVLLSGKQRTVRKDGAVWFPVYRCSGSKTTETSTCWTTIKTETLDSIVTELVKRELRSGRAGALTPTPEERQEVTSLRDEKRTILEEQRELAEDLRAGRVRARIASIADEGLEARLDATQTRIDSITNRYPLQSLFSDGTAAGRADIDRAAAIGADFDNLHLGQKRGIVGAVLDISVDRGRDPIERTTVRTRAHGTVLTLVEEDWTPTAPEGWTTPAPATV